MKRLITKGDRVRENTSKRANVKIDRKTFENIKRYSNSSNDEISRRIRELDNEWDIERVLEVNMSTLAIAGLVLSYKHRAWLALPSVVLGFFAQHAIQGWCPPVPLFRYLKVRTRNEIEEEKHALKALRGDYYDIQSAEEAYIAVKK